MLVPRNMGWTERGAQKRGDCDASSCCYLSSGASVACVEPADLCAPAAPPPRIVTFVLINWTHCTVACRLATPTEADLVVSVEFPARLARPLVLRAIHALRLQHDLLPPRSQAMPPTASHSRCSPPMKVSLHTLFMFPFSTDCDPFLKWNEDPLESQNERAILQPALDASLEAKAVEFLGAVVPKSLVSAEDFLIKISSFSDDTKANFMQSIVVFLSSSKLTITTTTMKILKNLIRRCSDLVQPALVKADLIPPIINALNPQTLSLSDCEHIHTYLISSIFNLFQFATPFGIRKLRIKDGNEQQALHEAIFQQVLVPSEEYIWHLCVNRESVIDGRQSKYFLKLLARLLEISPHYQPTMQFILHMPVFLTIPCCFTFFEADRSIWDFLSSMVNAQQEWNQTWGETRQMWKTMHRMLRTEGIEDVIEEKLRNDRDGSFGGRIVLYSIYWNKMLGVNRH
ncbi:hypothetical protein BLNAU_1032 [Blattamonas nauphoetae]|uniref:Uncharacterized protein n=1 Tax=Blattamonas nauphoetae TaxID=2049346 RepID=A0ABQ9YJL9_9EUKA|nr:hypothetical protein BLNAU_1032 [Blattamonas nauphoetae]